MYPIFGANTGAIRPHSRSGWRSRLAALVVVALIGALAACSVRVSGGKPDAEKAPEGDLPGWKSIFVENFDQPAALGQFLAKYGNKWDAYPFPYTDTARERRPNTPGYYAPDKTLSVANGLMDAWLHYDAALNKYLVAAPYPKAGTTTYARVAFRLRGDDINGYKVAPLMWPDSNNVADGELNNPEGNLNGVDFKAFAHFASPTGGQQEFQTGVNNHEWHVYEIAWSPGTVEFLVDGKSIGTSNQFVPSKPMHFILQFETWLYPKDPPKDAQGHVQVDWVKIYKWSGNS